MTSNFSKPQAEPRAADSKGISHGKCLSICLLQWH